MALPRRRDLVYSSDNGQMCPECRQPRAACSCRPVAATPKGDGIVRVARQTKGRKGKAVTVITGLPLDGVELAALAKELKRKCGCGGAVKDGAIEIQGDQRDRLVAELQQRGWTVKKAGG